jgi:hypothetical protein
MMSKSGSCTTAICRPSGVTDEGSKEPSTSTRGGPEPSAGWTASDRRPSGDPELSERERIAALGDVVPPPLARAVLRGLAEVVPFTRRTAVEVCAGVGGLAEGAIAVELEHLVSSEKRSCLDALPMPPQQRSRYRRRARVS